MLKLKPKVRARLELVRDHIMANYKQVDMGEWADNVKLGTTKPVTCGTTACIAGWYAIMLPKEERPTNSDELWKPLAIDLGLISKRDAAKCGEYWDWADDEDVEAYATIVHVGEWPDDLRQMYQMAEQDGDKMGMAYAAARRIQRLLDDGE